MSVSTFHVKLQGGDGESLRRAIFKPFGFDKARCSWLPVTGSRSSPVGWPRKPSQSAVNSNLILRRPAKGNCDRSGAGLVDVPIAPARL